METRRGRIGFARVDGRGRAGDPAPRPGASELRRPGRRAALPQAPDPPHLRPLRDHRPAVARRLSRAWRPEGAGARASRSARRRRSRRCSNRACADAAAPASRPGSSGAPPPRRRRDQKYIVCNADEGDSGTFADRMVMEGDPFMLIEGMAIAGLAVGATQGYIYIRSEYPHAIRAMQPRDRDRAARRSGAARSPRFDIEVRVGAGAYVCGEETSPAREHRGQARRGPRQAAAAGDRGPVRQADDHQQCADPRRRPVHPRRGREGLCRLRHGPLARDDADPACRQHQEWRPVRDRASGSRSASWSTRSAAAPCRGRPVRAVQVGGPLGRLFPAVRCSTCRSIMRPSPPPTG